MQITLSVNNNKEIRVLPVVPEDIDIDYQAETELIDRVSKGKLMIVKGEDLFKMDISSFFPSKKYSFMQKGSTASPKDYIDFVAKQRAEKKPFRVVVTLKNGEELVNKLCYCTNFKISKIERNKDVKYSMSFTETESGG
ncbi:MAG: hypothetical protein RR536_01845 [Anaerovoracaceae bacterium]